VDGVEVEETVELTAAEQMTERMEERVKEGLKTIAPKAVQLAIAFGQFASDGTYFLRHDTISIEYSPLLNVVIVKQGLTPRFAANLGLKRVTAFTKGSWEQVFNRLYTDRYQEREVAEVSEKNIYKLAVNLGLLS